MSHFSQIKTQIRSLDSLKSALADMGIEWKSGAAPVRGYKGQTQTAEVVIQQDNGYDVGFAWNGQEYELVADMQFWQLNHSVDHFLRQVTQRYAYHTVMTETQSQGFQVAEEQSNEDGSIRLVLQRWSA
ncbi:DUF1257 domain-containing protein [filamentous cyanobacterium LEGE 11480]|uniref:DUF1257 domain-containing protein n=1 Tax=Romeriopsis navalis LEGE 11480 TaxID=2777977 RepID=A0A928Z2N0_9CYAN|nr:DUF1257 domain-containing protein [Romeriopsis navalis]MBE9030556.1 DUF1257 domain-containing protein [Romeriopsis navalis LEGE 11480]